MGFFDKFKNVLGGGKSKTETVKGPTTVLREAGIDTSDLDCKVNADGSVTVSGHCASGDERDRVIETLEGMPNVTRVINEINIASAPEPEPEPEPQVDAPEPAMPAESPAESGDDSGKTYTVQPGDTLWKISQEMYGNGAHYMKIFEANQPMLENPDRIFPGQELKIPDLEG